MEEEEQQQPMATLAIPYIYRQPPPADAFIVADPIETYLKGLKPGEEPDQRRLTVAMGSNAIRSIYALIDNSQKRECILDPGSQVVAMSEEICHSLRLPYDPSIKIDLVSANGSTNASLGLARNVPFQISTVTAYLQVHIIRGPAYDILLGRPFDVVTGSIVRNFYNEDQTITIHDPNTGNRATIPTFARSKNADNSDKDF
jgi:hypothetical protein